MTVQLTVPTSADLAASYRARGLWDEVGLRNGLEKTAEQDPGRLAIVDNAGAWSYGQLRDDVERGVGALIGRGIEPGDAVLLVAPNSCGSVVAFCAILHASGIVVALDRRCGAADVAHAVESTHPRLVIAPASLIRPLGIEQLDCPALSLGRSRLGRLAWTVGVSRTRVPPASFYSPRGQRAAQRV